jgi:hypothetical protein
MSNAPMAQAAVARSLRESDPTAEKCQGLPGLKIQPVGVLDGKQHRLVRLAEEVQHLECRAVRRTGLRRGRAQGAEQVVESRVRDPSLRLYPGHAEHAPASLSRCPNRLLQEYRLAGAGVTAQDKGRAAPFDSIAEQ